MTFQGPRKKSTTDNVKSDKEKDKNDSTSSVVVAAKVDIDKGKENMCIRWCRG